MITKQNSEERGNDSTEGNLSSSPKSEKKLPDFSKFTTLRDYFSTDSPKKSIFLLRQFLSQKEKELLGDEYHVVYLYDTDASVDEYTADRIYQAVQENQKKLLLIIHNQGGRIEPAFLISKCCRSHSEKFVVCVPRKAKSAATLICLGAQEIHMGSMSELGPIDPQMGGLPALGLSNALECLAGLIERYPKSSDTFSMYLQKQLPLGVLGYFERITESAAQYAERLLVERDDAREIARKFVYEYKDHSFVIDKDEAIEVLGETVKSGTVEYQFGNLVHTVLEDLNLILRVNKGKKFSFIGIHDFDMRIDDIPSNS